MTLPSLALGVTTLTMNRFHPGLGPPAQRRDVRRACGGFRDRQDHRLTVRRGDRGPAPVPSPQAAAYPTRALSSLLPVVTRVVRAERHRRHPAAVVQAGGLHALPLPGRRPGLSSAVVESEQQELRPLRRNVRPVRRGRIMPSGSLGVYPGLRRVP